MCLLNRDVTKHSKIRVELFAAIPAASRPKMI